MHNRVLRGTDIDEVAWPFDKREGTLEEEERRRHVHLMIVLFIEV
jgi:hypothetical protein